ncbi:MAG: hypothetical protein ABIA59_07655 [Candidatus Latescibacterota bacterium]
MNIDARLSVFLKGADLVAETAYLTLITKMNYKGTLLNLKRFDSFRFDIESDAPEKTVSDLKDLMDRKSTFFNRNKHGHILHCRWQGGEFREGPELEGLRKRFGEEGCNPSDNKEFAKIVNREPQKKVIIEENKLFLVESLVEDQDSTVRSSVAGKLRADLNGIPVTVPSSGTLWWLLLVANSEAQARATAEEIIVSERRDKGLLLNPNYQRFETESIAQLELK